MLKIKASLYIASFALILVAVLLLTLFYRHVAIEALVQDSETDNETLTRGALALLSPALPDFLSITSTTESAPVMPIALRQSIAALMQDKRIREIEIYDTSGGIIYSSDPPEPRTNHAIDQGMREALAGRSANEFVYRDALSRLDRETAHDNIVQSYVPIVAPGSTRVVGVFELYANENDMVARTERTLMQFMMGGLIGFSLLYAALFAILRRAGKAMERHHFAVEEEKRRSALLSARVLHAEQKRTAKVAASLHEEVVQTLSAVKLSIEYAKAHATETKQSVNSPAIESVVPMIQEVMGAASSLAAELHPASLADLGLLPALVRLFDQFHYDHQLVGEGPVFRVTENQIPEHLKVTIYRSVQALFRYTGSHGNDGPAKMTLAIDKGKLLLRINLSRLETSRAKPTPAIPDEDVNGEMESMRERVIVSGGTCYVLTDEDGHLSFVAAWPSEMDRATDSNYGT